MSKKTDQPDSFFFQIAKGIIPQLLYSVFGAIVALIILRTDVTALTRRVDALERQIIGRDLATEKFNAINARLDAIDRTLSLFGAKLDRHLEK